MELSRSTPNDSPSSANEAASLEAERAFLARSSTCCISTSMSFFDPFGTGCVVVKGESGFSLVCEDGNL